ncbi:MULTISPECIES: DUF2267 domain-containing protein [Nonomuraea]|jgi:uncharacterized protein (DUF2267 family)|uniref:DUF2267 domain-containing protein n=2 Tax=Nonomuraea TaxID=83681 RepID=A0ABW1C860_9ACTN|nr:MULTISPECIES: DUF2267 domain-containing protein [Nonomuraea]MDA0644466.1 DUF2267 domain-containing protein [Nonomuraea ferruginea]TXK43247.1 DUF2267 domain-containing protein [Nonomuraea sp. C10]
MRHDDFVGQVQARARLGDRAHAERAIRASLETLGERLPESLADKLAAQLPHEIGENLRRTEVYGGLGTGEHFGREEFIRRVGARAGVDDRRAVFLARVVFEVTDEATQGRIMTKVRESLTEELRELATAGSQGHL